MQPVTFLKNKGCNSDQVPWQKVFHHMKQMWLTLSVLVDTSLSLKLMTNSDKGMKPSITLTTPSNSLFSYKIIFGAFLLRISGPTLTWQWVASLSLNSPQTEVICSTGLTCVPKYV